MATKWSHTEIAQAIVLMAHFHAFSSFSVGCGVLQALKDRQARGKSTKTKLNATRVFAENDLL